MGVRESPQLSQAICSVQGKDERKKSKIYLVMELMRPTKFTRKCGDPRCKHIGTDIFMYAAHKDLTPRDVARITIQVAHALNYLHNTRNVMHRDLKLENIFVDANFPDFGRVVLGDYGWSKQVDASGIATSLALVSPGIQAPETLGSGSRSADDPGEAYYDKKCDIWSLGVALYTALVRGLPFGMGPSANAKIKKGVYKWPAGRSVPQEMKDLIRRMLTVEPRERITVKEILQDEYLNQVAGFS